MIRALPLLFLLCFGQYDPLEFDPDFPVDTSDGVDTVQVEEKFDAVQDALDQLIDIDEPVVEHTDGEE